MNEKGREGHSEEMDVQEPVIELDRNPTSRPGGLPRCGDGGEGWLGANIVGGEEHTEYGRRRFRKKN